MSDTLLTRLRVATRPLHDQLDAGGVPDTRDAYARFIGGMLAAHRPLIDLVGPDQSQLVQRLECDARDLRVTARDVSWDGPTDARSAVGVRYVVLGSHFGSALLLRTITARLPDVPVRFLRGDGHEGERWRGFRRSLEDVPDDDFAAVEGGAVAAFRHFAHVLTQADVP